MMLRFLVIEVKVTYIVYMVAGWQKVFANLYHLILDKIFQLYEPNLSLTQFHTVLAKTIMGGPGPSHIRRSVTCDIGRLRKFTYLLSYLCGRCRKT